MRSLEPARVVAAVLALLALAGCDRSKIAGKEPGTTVATAAADAGAPTSKTASSAQPTPKGSCTADPKTTVAIPDTARATDVRIAAAGNKALVTWFEIKQRNDGPPLHTAFGHLYDAATGTLGPKTKLQENDVGDEPVSGAVPVVAGGDLVAVSCWWGAPAGLYRCYRGMPAEKQKAPELFAFSGISNGGPEKADIAAVVKGDDTLLAVPVGGDLQLFSARVSAKKKGSPFAVQMDAPSSAADAFGATLSGDDEVTFVYRKGGAIKARRAGFDQAWRGKAIDLSAKGALVGAPVVTSEKGHVVVLFSQRMKATDPWKVTLAELFANGEVKRTELADGAEQAQGPGIEKTAEPGCFHVSWVEGSGKTTRTKLARMCNATIVPSSTATLSTDGVEGGRATLAADPTAPAALFAVWQELPAGKPAELRVAKLACK